MRFVTLLAAFCVLASSVRAQSVESQSVDGESIGSISVRVRDIFDTSKPGENKAVYRLANRLHVDTREDALRAQLLFAEGDPFSVRVIEETERALRRLRYVRDPRVRVRSRHDGVVDLEVSAEDVWTMSPGVSFGRKGGTNSTGFEFDDYNLFGTGKRLSLGSSSSVDRRSNTFLWSDPNLFGSRWTTTAGYIDSDDGQTTALAIERPFYSFDTRWSAGLKLGTDDGIQHRYALGTRADAFRRETRAADLYFGTSRGWDDGWVRRFTTGLRMEEARFSESAMDPMVALLPRGRSFTYPYASLEYIQDDYATDTNCDQIERTEDFEFGKRLFVELGLSNAALSGQTAALLRANASRGWRLHQGHRLFVGAGMTGRFEGGNPRNSLYSASARYYWRTSDSSLFHVGLQGDFGRALDLDNELMLGGDNGLRGYPLRYQTGSSRALLTLEERFYTNWYPFRMVRVGGAVFADVGRSFGRGALDAPNLGTLRDVGFGLRFSNSRSALASVLHVDIAFPLDGDPSIDGMQFLIGTKRSF